MPGREKSPMTEPRHIFHHILQGTVPCQRVWEDEHTLCFRDIHPKAPIHALLIPKKDYQDALDFYAHASPEEVLAFQNAFVQTIKTLKLDTQGFRAITNQGHHGGQEVPHFHLHILGGEVLEDF